MEYLLNNITREKKNWYDTFYYTAVTGILVLIEYSRDKTVTLKKKYIR